LVWCFLFSFSRNLRRSERNAKSKTNCCKRWKKRLHSARHCCKNAREAKTAQQQADESSWLIEEQEQLLASRLTENLQLHVQLQEKADDKRTEKNSSASVDPSLLASITRTSSSLSSASSFAHALHSQPLSSNRTTGRIGRYQKEAEEREKGSG